MTKPRVKTLAPRVSQAPGKQLASSSGTWRTSDMTSTQRGYGYRWQQERDSYLRLHPLCVMCKDDGVVTVATVVDHRIPHRGDQALFWDRSNWQSLCATHHSRDKQRQEQGSLTG